MPHCQKVAKEDSVIPSTKEWIEGSTVHGILFISCRREALSVWKDKQGLAATYENLLELFETAGHSQCAEVVCEVRATTKEETFSNIALCFLLEFAINSFCF